jgi:hypothetical protein
MAQVTSFPATDAMNEQQLSCDERGSISIILNLVEKLQTLPTGHQQTAVEILRMLGDVRPDIRDDFFDIWCRARIVTR